jgi:hypothetical protein
LNLHAISIIFSFIFSPHMTLGVGLFRCVVNTLLPNSTRHVSWRGRWMKGTAFPVAGEWCKRRVSFSPFGHGDKAKIKIQQQPFCNVEHKQFKVGTTKRLRLIKTAQISVLYVYPYQEKKHIINGEKE